MVSLMIRSRISLTGPSKALRLLGSVVGVRSSLVGLLAQEASIMQDSVTVSRKDASFLIFIDLRKHCLRNHRGN